MLRSVIRRRCISTAPVNQREAWLFVDSVFPLQLAAWDLRHYIGILRQDYLLSTILSRLSSLKEHDFQVLDLEPQAKDGGLYVRFSYTESPSQDALGDIETAVRDEASQHGGFPTWSGFGSGNAWLVKGQPWKEDLNRYASPIVNVAFDGPDVPEQTLYEIFRPYGRIKDISSPTLGPSGTARSASVTFHHLRSAAVARNVLYGADLRSQPTIMTHIRTSFQKPIQAHAIRDWMSSHPKIMLPLVVFLLGTLTYTIFDPIRSLMVESKLLDWFDYRKYKLYEWLRDNTLARLSGPVAEETAPLLDVWKERVVARDQLKNYLTDMPTTVAFMHGPQGSGKTRMVQEVLDQCGRSVLYIDCRELQKTTSDSQLVSGLAQQTGYWPVFTAFNSMSSLIDLASVGLIGQKAGFSHSLSEQLQQILNVVGMALKRVASAHRATSKRKLDREVQHELYLEQQHRLHNMIVDGTWHDGRLDCVAGNGIISELGVGDEVFDANNAVALHGEGAQDSEKPEKRDRSKEDLDVINALPIVVIKHYSSRIGATRDELLTVLAQWVATLAENQVAHVIVLSDNRENAKRIAQALPSKPLYSIGLSDADPSSSLSFMRQKLGDAGIDVDLTPQQTTYVTRLGGRASDLESLIHKVRSGQSVEDAVEEIISQGVSELRKYAFGDDVGDAKALEWTREQIWGVIKLLSKQPEIPYYDLLVDFPFKGDETALRNMEHAELITIGTKDGRPSNVKPGKPVFRWVFERLVKDPTFQAAQDIYYNDKAIAKAESTIKTCEDELQKLSEIMATESRHWYDWIVGRRSACRERARYLAQKMSKAEKKVEALERMNDVLKKKLVNSY